MRRVICILIIGILSVACATQNTLKIKVIHTADLRESIFSNDLTGPEKRIRSLAQVSSILQEKRSITDQRVILIHQGALAGAFLQEVLNLSRGEAKHDFVDDLVTYLKYDVIVPSSADIESHPEPIEDREAASPAPLFLATNISVVENEDRLFTPYRVFEYEGIRVGVLGWLHEGQVQGLNIESAGINADYWCSWLQEHEKPDYLIGVFPDGIRQEILSRCSQLDLALVATESESGSEVVTLASGKKIQLLKIASQATSVGLVELEFRKKFPGFGLSAKAYVHAVDPGIYPADWDYLRLEKTDLEMVQNKLNQEIAFLESDLKSEPELGVQSLWMNLLHQIILEASRADFTILGTENSPRDLKRGPVKVRDIMSAIPQNWKVMTIALNGQELLDYLEYAYDHGVKTETTFGIRTEYDATLPAGSRIRVRACSTKKPFGRDQNYRIAVPAYRLERERDLLLQGGKFTRIELRRRVVSGTRSDIRKLVVGWLERKKPIALRPEVDVRPEKKQKKRQSSSRRRTR